MHLDVSPTHSSESSGEESIIEYVDEGTDDESSTSVDHQPMDAKENPQMVGSKSTVKIVMVKPNSGPTQASRVVAKDPNMSPNYKLFIQRVFCDGVPPVVIYDNAIHKGDKIFKLLSTISGSVPPADGEHWILFKNKMELHSAHRDKAIKWIAVLHEGRSMLLCICE